MINQLPTSGEGMMKKLNGHIGKVRKCSRCGKQMQVNDRCAIFRERALSMREASHAGTMYPRRAWCVTCAARVDK